MQLLLLFQRHHLLAEQVGITLLVEADDPARGLVVLQFIASLAELLFHAGQTRLAGIKLIPLGVNNELQRPRLNFVDQLAFFHILIGLHMNGFDVTRHIGRHRDGVGVHVGVRGIGEVVAVDKKDRQSSHRCAT